MKEIRYANIGAAVAMAFVAPMALIFKDSGEGAAMAIVVIGFILGSGTLVGLSERDRRRRERDQ